MTKEQILNHVNYDIDKAKAIHEWLNEGESVQEPTTTNHDAIIEVYKTETYEGVRVQALGEDFVIGLHDLDDGKSDFSYATLMPRLNKLGMHTFTKRQSQLVCFLLDEINDKLKESGGDTIAEDWYLTQDLYIPRGSSTDYSSVSSWCFDGTYGCLYNDYRCHSYFRCRPVLDLSLQN